MELTYRPIGVVHTPFDDPVGMPIQPAGAVGIRGTVEVMPEFAGGLKDLEGFSHIILLYHFHLVKDTKLLVMPFMDVEPRGIFSTRAPKRPNPIGLSIVRLLRVEGSTLHVENVDILNEILTKLEKEPDDRAEPRHLLHAEPSTPVPGKNRPLVFRRFPSGRVLARCRRVVRYFSRRAERRSGRGMQPHGNAFRISADSLRA